MNLDRIEIVFLQKREIINQQEKIVIDFLKKYIPDAKVRFFGSAEQIPFGTFSNIVIAPTLEWLDDALRRLQGVEWIHFLSAGVEKIWNMDFDKHAVLMSKSSGAHVNTMSEFAIAAILYFEKQFNKFISQSKHKEWSRAWLGELTGKKLVILGAGAIGQKLAERASIFGMEVVGVVNSQREIPGLSKVVLLDEVEYELVDTDYLVICLPLTDVTKGIVDLTFLSSLKPNSILIDISRGGVTCEDAVLAALDLGILRGAALDVFEQQPLPKSSKLWARDDVLITPHVSGTTQHYMLNALEVFLRNYQSIRDRGKLRTPVSVDIGY